MLRSVANAIPRSQCARWLETLRLRVGDSAEVNDITGLDSAQASGWTLQGVRHSASMRKLPLRWRVFSLGWHGE